MKIRLTLLYSTALALAGVGAAVSLSGLVTMFGLSFLPIGAGMEIGKLSGAAALHRHWGTLSVGVRCALSAVVGTLMVLTSVGVYGFAYEHYLAHVAEATAPAIERMAAVEASIQAKESQVSGISVRLAALDAAPVIEVASAKGAKTAKAIAASAKAMAEASKLRAIEEGQRRVERAALASEHEARAAELTVLQAEHASAASAVKSAEAEVGPVRVVAEALGVDPGKVIAVSIASIYDLLCVLLLLVASHEQQKIRVLETPVIVAVGKRRKRSRSEAAQLGWERRKFKALEAKRKLGPVLIRS